MTTYNFSDLPGTIAFDPLTDILVLDSANGTNEPIALGNLLIAETSSGVSFVFENQTVTLDGVTLQDLAASTTAGVGNVQFDGAGLLRFGDQDATTHSDAGVGPINGTSGDDYIVGGDGNDDFRGGNGNDVLIGGAGDDHITGGKGNDYLIGGDGNDYLKGGSGNDYLDGGAGDDILDESGDIGVQQATGESSAPGNNIMSGGAGNDLILGGAGNDTIGGGMGDDILIGGAGDDYIRGGQGDDLIDGGVGNDTLRGDAGNDTFRFVGDGSVIGGQDTIQDFTHGEDKIMLSDASGAQLTGAALTAAIQGALDTFHISGGNGVFALDNNETVVLTGVTSLDASDFTGTTLPAVSVDDQPAQTEGNTFNFNVSLDAASAFDTTVNYTDSLGGNGSIVIAAGDTTGIISVGTSNNTYPGGDQALTVTLTNVTNGTIADNSGASTILDDDSNPTIADQTTTFAATNVFTDLDATVTVGSGQTDGAAAGWGGGSLVVNANVGNVDIDLDIGGSVQVLGGTGGFGNPVVVNGTLVGTIGNGFGDSNASIIFNSDATTADVEAVVEALQVRDNVGIPTNYHTVTVQLTNADGNSTSNTVTLTTVATTPLAISDLDGDSSLVQRTDAASQLDTDGVATQNVVFSEGVNANGATISVAITAGGDALDSLTLDGADSAGASIGIYNDKYVVVDNAIIGTITAGANNSNAFTVTFNGNATDARINTFLQNLTFDTQNGAVDGERTITITETSASGQTAQANVSVSVAGHIFELTTADDTGAAFTGDTGVDVFSGPNGASAAAGTLNDGDVLNGGGGLNDRLIVNLGDGSGNGNTVAPTISGVNFFQLTSSTADAISANGLDFSHIGDVTNVAVQGDQDLTLSHVGVSLATLNASAFDGDLTVGFDADGTVNIMSGSGDDTFNFGSTLGNSDSVNGGDGSDTVNATVAASIAPNLANVENVNLTASADLTVNAGSITGAALSTVLNLDDGGGTDIDVTVTNVGDAIGTIDGSGLADAASSLTVSVAGRANDITIIGSAGNDSITGGDGDDTLSGGGGDDTITTGAGTDTVNAGAGNDTINDADLSAADTIDGGANTDTLNGTISANYAPDAGHLTGVETVNLTLTGDFQVDLSAQGATTTLNLFDGATADVDANVVGNNAALTTLDASGLDGVGSSLTFTATAASNLTLTGSGGDDTLNFGTTLDGNDTVDGGNGTDTLTATIGGGGYNPAAGHLMNVETLSFTGSADSTIDLTNVTGAHTVQLSDGLNADIDITLTGLASSITSVDASNLNDAASSLDATFANAADVTVTGSAGDDAFHFGTTFDANDVVHAGTGADSLDAELTTGSFTAAAGSLTGLETVSFDQDADGTINMANASGLTTINVAANDVDITSTITVSDSTTTVNLDDGGHANNDVTVNGITASSSLATVDASNLTDATDSLSIDASLDTHALTITGSAGVDTITGGSGNDTITGGNGGDTMNGGLGADNFVYTANAAADVNDAITALQGQTAATGAGVDTINGFSIAQGDTIDVSQFADGLTDRLGGTNDLGDASWHFIGTNSFTGGDGVAEIRYAQDGGNTIIQFDLNGDTNVDATITLTGVYTLSAGQFHLGA